MNKLKYYIIVGISLLGGTILVGSNILAGYDVKNPNDTGVYFTTTTDNTLRDGYGGPVRVDQYGRMLVSPSSSLVVSSAGTEANPIANGYFLNLDSTTSTAKAIVSSTSAVITGSLNASYLTSSSIPYIGTGGLLTENNSSMYFDGTSAYFTSLYSGLITAPEDGGLVDIMNISVTTGASAGTEEGFNFLIDGNQSFSIARDSDGAGTVGVTSTVYIGTATSVGCLAIGDTDSGGFSYCTTLNGTLTCSSDPCN